MTEGEAYELFRLPVLIVVSYDVPDDRRRGRLGVLGEIDVGEDRVRIYRFCEDCGGKGEILGPGWRTEDLDVYVL